MWSPSAQLIRVGLSPRGLAIARLPRFGLGLGMGLSLARQQAVEYLACPPAPDAAATAREPWRDAVDLLGAWLSASGKRPGNVQVCLGGRLARWQLLPWRAELSGPAERSAYAALRFRETYGKAAQSWQVLPATLLPGSTAPAAAVDRALVDALAQACSSSGAQLQSITPYFSAAFDAWRKVLAGPAVWFCTVEADTLTLGLLQRGQWTALQTQRMPGDWHRALQTLLQQMALACEVSEPLPLYLAGDVAQGATPATLAGQPCTWLQPQPLHTPTPSGLRLAMGC